VSVTSSSTTDVVPHDPAGEAAAIAITEILHPAAVQLRYSPCDHSGDEVSDCPAADPVAVAATGPGPEGWELTFSLKLSGRIAAMTAEKDDELGSLLCLLPAAALRAAARVRRSGMQPDRLDAPLRRAVRDLVVVELLGHHPALTNGDGIDATALVAEALEYLVELSGTRVEAEQVTHGVLIADVFQDEPRLQFEYPDDLRPAKRAPLLFDGQRSVLVVDRRGRARFELQRHRLDEMAPSDLPEDRFATEFAASGSLVSNATRRLGGIGFFLRADRSIWVYLQGQPLVLRRGEHWTAFPLELTTIIDRMIGGGQAARTVVQAAYLTSAMGHGAILAIVADASQVDDAVSPKDRYDLRDEQDLEGMRPETRLHHLIDAEHLDAQTLARLADLDGATIVDRESNLIAYGAIVTSANSEHEGARTAAAKTLSTVADVVLKVSQDGDVTVFAGGEAVATLLDQRGSS
jgi:hypothetical protein